MWKWKTRSAEQLALAYWSDAAAQASPDSGFGFGLQFGALDVRQPHAIDSAAASDELSVQALELGEQRQLEGRSLCAQMLAARAPARVCCRLLWLWLWAARDDSAAPTSSRSPGGAGTSRRPRGRLERPLEWASQWRASCSACASGLERLARAPRRVRASVSAAGRQSASGESVQRVLLAGPVRHPEPEARPRSDCCWSSPSRSRGAHRGFCCALNSRPPTRAGRPHAPCTELL